MQAITTAAASRARATATAMSETFDTAELDTQDASFQRAGDGYKWRGNPLPHCWNSLRKDVAKKLGLLFGNVPDRLLFKINNPRKAIATDGLTPEQIKEIQAEPDEITVYDMNRDLQITLWVLHQDKDKLKDVRRAFYNGLRNSNWKQLEDFWDEIDDFADEHGISERNTADVETVIQILSDDANSAAYPTAAEKHKGDSKKKDNPKPKPAMKPKSSAPSPSAAGAR